MLLLLLESDVEDDAGDSSSGLVDDPRREMTGVPRPPSYISEDGVDYVVEAQPRSIAPTTDVPLASSVHPSENGRAGRPAGW